MDEKARESRLRRLAKKQGYVIRKSRIRPENQHLDDQGGYMVINNRNIVEAGQRFDLTLDDVEKFLKE